MAASRSIQVLQLSDTHLFADPTGAMLGCHTDATLTAVLEKVHQLPSKPDLLLLTGDLSQDETPASYQRLWKLLEPYGVATYWIPGNHDIPALMSQHLATAPFSADKSFQAGGWQFILLSTHAPRTVEGKLAPESLTWLEEQLQQCCDRPTLIALHHPPCPIGSAWMDEIGLHNPESLYTILDRYPQVKLVIFGHIHQEFETTRRSITYLGCPSTCVQFKTQQPNLMLDPVGPGFRILTLHPNGRFETQVKRINR